MSNPTELPDLDKLVHDCVATTVDILKKSGMIIGLNPELCKDIRTILIKRHSRAQPEGEAPQAETFKVCRYVDGCRDDWKCSSAPMGDCGAKNQAAQQAAAPGALPGWKLVPVEPTPEMIAAMHFKGDVDIAIGHAQFYKDAEEDYAAMLSAAPSAPGTPEAPGLPGQTDEEAYAGSGYHHVMSLDTFKTFRREYENRAAQLDGGQGDGA
ncbi:hypothetical protein ACFOHT_04680 [Massilia oculi]|uniref:Uncharacterized protein n=1 Tax=Massilia oculi TaxID=945844 RepID=A0A2S2DDE1_9BURK|nr:hypothetical protein [Massilia oculi]AWL03371.1 hypothetical protein DIR46_02160 [Massilia oculi]